MPSITITSVTFSQTPIAPMNVNFYYKTGAGSPIAAPGNPHTVPVNGILSVPIVINGLSYSTLYTISAVSECGEGEAVFEKDIETLDCTCPVGFTKSSSGDWCEKVETVPATVTHSNYCLAISKNTAYTSLFTRIYNLGFSNATLGQVTPSRPQDVYAQLTLETYWKNDYRPSLNNLHGPMNNDAVWIDSDCNGVKDSLASGSKTTIGYAYFNAGGPKTVYVGIGGDNIFTLKVNGVVIAEVTVTANANNFKIWHVVPVVLQSGWNDFNAIGTGDGSVNDAIAMVVYDNTAAELVAATQDSDLTILFRTSSLIGNHIDVATCADTYSLVMGLHGTYYCRKITIAACGAAEP